MDRSQLEDRIRASLQARADDVRPTPALWERVSDRVARRSRWLVGLWALAGTAAVAVVALAVLQVVRAPEGPPAIDNPPETVDPTPTQDATDPRPGPVGGAVSVVTTDGSALYEVDAGSGEVVAELPVFDGLSEGGPIGSVAVRPAGGPELTVATMIGVEASSWELDVTTFGPDRAHQERHRATPLDEEGLPDIRGAGGPFTTDSEAFPPTVVWSPDGQYLAWVRVNPDGTGDVMGIAHDALVAGEEPVAVYSGLAADNGHLRAQSWLADGTLWLTGSGGGEMIVDMPTSCLDGTVACDLPSPRPLGMEGGSIIDVAHHANGTMLALVGRGSPNQDAEGSTVELLAAPMGDNQHVLELPPGSVLDGAAVPPDGWLAAAGGAWAVVGYGPSAQLLTLTGELEEDLVVTDAVDLPGGTRAADLAVTGTEQATADPEPGPSNVAAVGADAVPEHVIVQEDAPRGPLALVHRDAPTQPLATWGRPDGLAFEATVGPVVVHPASTPTSLDLVSMWSVGESDTFVHTAIRDGTVVVNRPLDAEGQPLNRGGAADIAGPTPVFSPSGAHMAWVETPEGSAGPARVRIVTWSADGPTGPTVIAEAPDGDTRPVELLDWATSPDGDVLTLAPMWSLPDQVQPSTLIELDLSVVDGVVQQPSTADWRAVTLPATLVDAGSFRFEDGSERYVVFGDGPVLYGLAQDPDTAVEIRPDTLTFHFGPDSVVYRRAVAEGGWERAQVDTGAASPVRAPEGTVALLPWTTAAGG